MKDFFCNIENYKLNHKEYIEKIDIIKRLVDRTPNCWLDFHKENAIRDEWYEIAEYITAIGIKRFLLGIIIEPNLY